MDKRNIVEAIALILSLDIKFVQEKKYNFGLTNTRILEESRDRRLMESQVKPVGKIRQKIVRKRKLLDKL